MFDKLKFNNLVISNKKRIQQARVQTINKFVQKIRKLKSLLEKRSDDEKQKHRLRKTTENMEQLKKLKCVDIMRRILLADTNPNAVITNGRATPEEVAIAMLSINKVMQALAQEFRSALQLSAKDQTWRQEIMATSKRREKFERTDEKRRKRKALKDQKAMEHKRKEWLDQNQQDGNDVTSTTGPWQTEEMQTAQEVPVREAANIKVANKQKAKKKPLNDKTTNTVEKPEIKQKQEATVQKNLNKAVPPINRQQPKQMLFESNVDDVTQDQQSSSNVIETEVTHVVDPFFITETGESYLSTAIVKVSNEDSDIDDKHGDLSSYGTNKNSRRRLEQKSVRQLNERSERREFKPKNQSAQKTDYNNRLARNSDNMQRINDQAKREKKLHPSWLAKQRQKPTITSFAGKKIKFGDTDDGEDVKLIKTFTPEVDASQTSSKIADASLHPSWVAKQKLKPKIAEFQGKKITFDNED